MLKTKRPRRPPFCAPQRNNSIVVTFGKPKDLTRRNVKKPDRRFQGIFAEPIGGKRLQTPC